ncbi:MAG TPA: hypothetical protein VFN18_11450 [Solirubrobacterales bacterium]|nr:hypothetical protein [Solirubrobacterales bacterium]
MVDEAVAQYSFYGKEDLLVRCPEGGGTERFVNGRWVPARRPRSPGSSSKWKPLTAKKLRRHAREYFVEDFGAEPVDWGEKVERFKRTFLYRHGNPPMKGGSMRRPMPEMFDRSRDAFAELLANTDGEALEELRDQALLGYEHQRERITAAEQRANFFLGTAGLTTSLVLANAGLLLGADKLGSPWRMLSAIALLFASIFALNAGFRALQATMLTFGHFPPNGVTWVMGRRRLSKEAMTRSYIGALLVGQHRLSAIADWKLMRMKEARSWFVWTGVAVFVLTAFVLVDVFFG